jgi:hypothetical protein
MVVAIKFQAQIKLFAFENKTLTSLWALQMEIKYGSKKSSLNATTNFSQWVA